MTNNQQRTLLDRAGLRLVDVITLGTIVFGGGAMWQQVQYLQEDLAALKVDVSTGASRGLDGRTGTAERLARMEALLLQQRDDTGEIKRRLERLEERERGR
jgi:hypothetical protein